MKLIPRLALAVTLALSIVACGNTKPTADLDPESATQAQLRQNFWNFVKDDPDFKKVREQLNINSPEDLDLNKFYSLDNKNIAKASAPSSGDGSITPQAYNRGFIDVMDEIYPAGDNIGVKAKPSLWCQDTSGLGTAAYLLYDGRFLSPVNQWGTSRYTLGSIRDTLQGSTYVAKWAEFFLNGRYPEYYGEGEYIASYNFKASCAGYKGWGAGTSRWNITEDAYGNLTFTRTANARPVVQGDGGW